MYKGLTIALIGFILDQVHKIYMVDFLKIKVGEFIEVTSFFNLVMVWNKGVSFGFLGNGVMGKFQPFILVGLTLIIIAVLISWLKSATTNNAKIGLGLVIAGALGNAADRLHWGAVADFFDFYINNWHWPAFNIADSFICIGVLLLIIDSIANPKDASKKDVAKKIR